MNSLPLLRASASLYLLILFNNVTMAAPAQDAGQTLRVSVEWWEKMDPAKRDLDKKWDTLRINELPEGMTIEQGLLACACPTNIAELKSYYRGLSKQAPWPLVLDEKLTKSLGSQRFVEFDPVVKLEGFLGAKGSNGTFTLTQGDNNISCTFMHKELLATLIEGSRIRIVGVVNLGKLTETISIAFVVLDPTFQIEDFAGTQGGDERWLKLLSEPLTRQTVKKASLKERKEYGDLILQSAKIKDWDTVREAVEEGGLINTREEYDHANALTYALRETMPIEKRRDLVKFLLEHGALPADDGSKLSSIATVYLGTQWNDVELVALLLRAGARPGTEFNSTPIKSPLQLARELGNAEMVSLLSSVIDVTNGEPMNADSVGQIRGRQSANKQKASPDKAEPYAAGSTRLSKQEKVGSANASILPSQGPDRHTESAQEKDITYPSDSIINAFRAVAAAKGRIHGISGKDKCILEVISVEGDVFTGVYHDKTSGFPFSYTVVGKVSDKEASFTAKEWVEKPSIAAESDKEPGSGCSAEMKLEANGFCIGKVRYKTWERSKLTLCLTGKPL